MQKVEVSWALSKLTKPECVTMIVTVDSKGIPNMMPASWVMRTSFHPPMVAVSIGHTRYTHSLICEQREFVLAFPSEGMEEAIQYCGSHSGKNENKLEKCHLVLCPASQIKPPLIENAVVNFETKVCHQVDTGDHTIFIAHVVEAHREPGKKILLNMGNFQYQAFEVRA